MANAFGVKKTVAAVAASLASVVLIRAKSLGNNCGFISDGYKNITGKGIPLLTPAEIKTGFGEPEWAIRWGTTTPIPNKKTKVLNKAEAIKQTIDKAGFRKLASTKGLTPKYWDSYTELQNYDGDVSDAGVIVRAREHSRSEDLYHCTTPAQVEAAIKKLGTKGHYISEYVKKNRELRVFVVQGRAVMVFEKKPKNKADVSWGCVEEGALAYIGWDNWPLEAVRVAIESFNLSKLDFGAVDVIMKDGKAYMLEINTAPEVWAYYGERLAHAFHYMMTVNRNRLPVKKWDNWKSFGHPTLDQKVIV